MKNRLVALLICIGCLMTMSLWADNNPLDAISLTLPETGTVYSIDPVMDVDWYKFYLPQGTTWTVHTEAVNGSQLDPAVWYYGPHDESGITIMEDFFTGWDDNSYGNLQPEVQITATDGGWYFIRMAEHTNEPIMMGDNTDALTGDYALYIEEEIIINNNSPLDATPLTLPETGTVYSIDPAMDVDWYKFYLPQGTTWTVHTEAVNGSQLDPAVWYYGPHDESGITIMEDFFTGWDDNSYGNLQPEVQITATDGGWYFIRMAEHTNEPIMMGDNTDALTGDYALYIEEEIIINNNSPMDATPLTLPETGTVYSIDPAMDVDWYKFYLPQGTTWTVHTEAVNGSQLDPAVWYYGPHDETGITVMEDCYTGWDDNSFGNLQPEVQITTTDGGWYFIRMAEHTNEPILIGDNTDSLTGDYALYIEEEIIINNNSPLDATPLTLPETGTVYSIDPAMDVDWYKFYLPQGTTWTVHTEAVNGSQLDPAVWYYGPHDETGITVMEDCYTGWDDNSFGNLQPEVQITATDGGWYFIRMAEHTNEPILIGDNTDSLTGDYALYIEESAAPTLPVPSNLMVEQMGGGGLNDAWIHWFDPNTTQTVLGYNLYRNGICINDSLLMDTVFADLDLENGTYDYYATALYNEGESEPSNTATFVVNIPQCTLAGIVTDRFTGDPIVNATISNGTVEATTDITGSYSMEIPPGFQDFTCTADSYYNETTTLDITTGQPNIQDFELVDTSKLYFVETWDSWSFNTNGWSFSPEQSNWQISWTGSQGPFAQFTGHPIQVNYAKSLSSPWFDATAVNTVTLNFTYYGNVMNNPQEVCLVEVQPDGGDWTIIDTLTHQTTWTQVQYDLSALVGYNGFTLRFTAFGEDSGDVDFWGIDSIEILGSLESSTLTGTVLDAQTMQPIGGACVTVDTVNCYTDDAGMFSCILNPGTYDLAIQADGYYLYNETVTLSGGQTTDIQALMIPAEPMYSIETWESASFSTNNWIFPEGQSHWEMWDYGHPGYSARFIGYPLINGSYSTSLHSSPYDAAFSETVYLSYDLTLSIFEETDTETLDVDVRTMTGDWVNVARYVEDTPACQDSFKTEVIDISDIVAGQQFVLRFHHYGTHSTNLIRSYIDNIRVFNGLANIPGTLQGTVVSAVDQTPVANAEIAVAGEIAVTDASGWYSVDITPSMYIYTADHLDYYASFDICEVTPGDTSVVDIQLVPHTLLAPPVELAVEQTPENATFSWSAPQSDVVELYYDENQVTEGYCLEDGTLATRFSPTQPCTILALKYYTIAFGAACPLTAEVYAFNDTTPALDASYSTTTVALQDDWTTVDCSGAGLSFGSDFVIGCGFVNQDCFLGFDENLDNGRSWDLYEGSWSTWHEAYLVRALVMYDDGSVATLAPSGNHTPSRQLPKHRVESASRNLRSSRDLTGYAVYLDNQYMGETADTSYVFTDLTLGQNYVAAVKALYDEGESDLVSMSFVYDPTSSPSGMVPAPTALNGNYPNPFNPETTISYNLQQETKVKLDIYNAKGQLVRKLVHTTQEAGAHTILWNGKDTHNKPVASGLYFYKLDAGSYQKSRKMILLK